MMSSDEFLISDEEDVDLYTNYVKNYNEKQGKSAPAPESCESSSSLSSAGDNDVIAETAPGDGKTGCSRDSDVDLLSSDSEECDPLMRLKKPIRKSLDDSFDELRQSMELGPVPGRDSKCQGEQTIEQIKAIRKCLKRPQMRVENEDTRTSVPAKECEFYFVVRDLNGGSDLTAFLDGDASFHHIFQSLSHKWSDCDLDHILLTLVSSGARILPHDTPLALHFDPTKTIILSALHLPGEGRAREDAPQDQVLQVPNAITLKWQWQSTAHRQRLNSLTQVVSQDATFGELKKTLAERLNECVEHLELHFDGDRVADHRTPRDLHLEDEDCLDVVVNK